MAAYIARIERSNRKDLKNVEVQVTITDLSPGRQSWSGEFVSRSADAGNHPRALYRHRSTGLAGPGSDGRSFQATRGVREGLSRAAHTHPNPRMQVQVVRQQPT